MRALAKQLAGDPHLADDAVQDTWLAALQQSQAPGLFADFGRGWLCVVARNYVLQTLRGNQRRQRREQAVAKARGPHIEDERGIDADVRARLLAAVNALPEDYRVVVQHRFFADRMPVAIADALGLPVETVRTRLKRAVERLRAAMTAPRHPQG